MTALKFHRRDPAETKKILGSPPISPRGSRRVTSGAAA